MRTKIVVNKRMMKAMSKKVIALQIVTILPLNAKLTKIQEKNKNC